MKPGLLAILFVACATPGPYPCEADLQCTRDGVTGVCQPQGFCSFVDLACAGSGQRFDATAEEVLAGECVPAEPVNGCILQVTLGDKHTCVRTRGGTLECWGANSSGQIGNGDTATTMEAQTPVPILGFVSDAAAGLNATCATDQDGARCWGENQSAGKLGNGGSTQQESPVPVMFQPPVVPTQLTAGHLHHCALVEGGQFCWGNGLDGQLGTEMLDNENTPAVAAAGLSLVEIRGGGLHTCGREPTGTVKCWGNNNRGQIGNSDNGPNVLEPALVMGVDNAVEIATGQTHSCAVTADGRLFCWGKGENGQLGQDTNNDADIALPVPGLTDIIHVATGAEFTCALDATGRVRCFGQNTFGQLGNNSTDNAFAAVDVIGLTDATAIAAGDGHACARRRDDSLVCWGNNRNSRAQVGSPSTALEFLVPTDAAFVCP